MARAGLQPQNVRSPIFFSTANFGEDEFIKHIVHGLNILTMQVDDLALVGNG